MENTESVYIEKQTNKVNLTYSIWFIDKRFRDFRIKPCRLRSRLWIRISIPKKVFPTVNEGRHSVKYLMHLKNNLTYTQAFLHLLYSIS
jgi:hypothetical protein